MNIFKQHQFYLPEEIERRANDLLAQMQVTPKYAPTLPLDASRVADFLDLAVVWDKIPADDKGLIAARILPLERLIEINEDIPQLVKDYEGFAASTIAHEIGHWILHIKPDEVDRFLKLRQQGIKPNIQPFLCRSANDQKRNDSIEWQAQYFASCLLMPKHILEAQRVGRDLTSWRDLYAMKDELGVTISNLTNRLQNLRWIHIPSGSKQIYLGKAAPSRDIGTNGYSDSDRLLQTT